MSLSCVDVDWIELTQDMVQWRTFFFLRLL